MWRCQCAARVSKQGVLLGGKQCTQTVKSKGNQNSAWSVDQSVNEDLRDSSASCRVEIQAVGVKTQASGEDRQAFRMMAGEEMEKIRLFLCIIYHMNDSDLMAWCFH